MKKNQIKTFFSSLAFLTATSLLTSCNRGYGCPTFSLNDTIVDVVGVVLNFIF